MLRELFPKLYKSYQQSSWAKELEEFGMWLRAAGYSRDSASEHVCRLRKVWEREAKSTAKCRIYSGSTARGIPLTQLKRDTCGEISRDISCIRTLLSS